MAYGPEPNADMSWVFPERISAEVIDWLRRAVESGDSHWVVIPRAYRRERVEPSVGKVIVSPA